MTNEILKLYNLLNLSLRLKSPVLSGNMRSGIEVKSISGNKVVLCINAPFYDLKEWQKTGKIQHNKKSYSGITDYAMWVNNYGGFHSHNASEHWVNRTCYEVARIIAEDIGAIVVNKLPIN